MSNILKSILLLLFIIFFLFTLLLITYYSIQTYLKTLCDKPLSFSFPKIVPKSASTPLKNFPKTYDVLIIGAGVVGSTLAIAMAKQGRRVCVIERRLGSRVDKESIIGELLQPSGVAILGKLGLGHVLNFPEHSLVRGYEISLGGKTAVCPYPRRFEETLICGVGFHNHRFVQRLRDEFGKYSNIDLIEGTVKTLLKDQNTKATKGVTFKKTETESTEEVFSDLVAVCDGCFSSFRDEEERRKVVIQGYFLGFCMKNCDLSDFKKAVILLQKPSNVLIYPVGEGDVRVLIDFEAKINRRDLNEEFFDRIRRNLPEKLKRPFDEAVREKRFRVMPSQVLPQPEKRSDGLIFVGDSFNMRHPITGAGMTVALTDVCLLADHFRELADFKDFPSVDQAVNAFWRHRKKENATLNILSSALYSVINSPNHSLREAFVQYVSAGGHRVEGPMRLISGFSRSEWELFLHFFAVSFEAARVELNKEGFFLSPRKLLNAYLLLKEGVGIFAPLVENESFSPAIKMTCRVGKAAFIL